MREVIAYEFDDFRLDVKRRELLKNGEPLALTHKAFQVLSILVQNFGQTVEKENIYKELWADSFVEDANLTQHIYILRKTLGKNRSGESYIETVARTGYRFRGEVRAVFSPSVLKAQEYFARPRSSAEPALKLDHAPESHLKLAPPIPAALTDEQAGTETPRKKYWLAVAAGTLVVLLAAGLYLALFRTPAGSGASQARSVAVLPFEPIGEETSDSKLGLGMADAIITRLSALKQIPVRPTSSVIKYTDETSLNSLAIGKSLGVETVLEGTVQRDGDRVRISVKLLDVGNGRIVWADSFDENYTGLFDLQDSISKRVARALEISLTRQQESMIASRSTSNPDAYQAYQLGVYYGSKRSKENLLKAEQYFSQAIAIDPNYAKAHAMLADTYNMLRYYRFADPQEMRDKALISATKALELDKSEAEAYVALANVQGGGKQGQARAMEMLEKAIELSPYNANARVRYGWGLVLVDLDRAAEQMRLAQEYDPLSGISNGAYCNVLTFQKKFKEAIKYCEKAVEISPEAPSVRTLLSDAYFLDGRYEDAIAQINLRINETEGTERLAAKGSLGYYLTKLGRAKEAEAIVRDLRTSSKEHPPLLNDLILISYAAGRPDEGYKYFLDAYDKRVIPGLMLQFNPIWSDVWADERVRLVWRDSAPPKPVVKTK